ncbi:MAG: molybdenum cofactor guanylyltransferase [Ktedonobacteraceae bacterium]
MFSTAGIILAGGRSIRMGRDKALLPLPDNANTTFVEHLVTVLAAQCSEVVLVVRSQAQAVLYEHPGISIVTDDTPDVGPLMGLYTGLHTIHASHALVMAVDMPYVQPEMVAFLLSQPLDETSLLMPVVNDIPQVLFAVYPRAILPIIEERLHAGRRDPRSLLDVVPVQYIGEAQLREIDPQLRSFVNMNTPEDYSPLSTSI